MIKKVHCNLKKTLQIYSVPKKRNVFQLEHLKDDLIDSKEILWLYSIHCFKFNQKDFTG